MKTDAMTGIAIPVVQESTAINSWLWLLDLPDYEQQEPTNNPAQVAGSYDGYEPFYRP